MSVSTGRRGAMADVLVSGALSFKMFCSTTSDSICDPTIVSLVSLLQVSKTRTQWGVDGYKEAETKNFIRCD